MYNYFAGIFNGSIPLQSVVSPQYIQYMYIVQHFMDVEPPNLNTSQQYRTILYWQPFFFTPFIYNPMDLSDISINLLVTIYVYNIAFLLFD